MQFNRAGEMIPFLPVVVAIITAVATGVLTVFSLWFQRHQEKLSVTRAILAEVSRLLAILPRHLSWWNERRSCGDIEAPLISFSTDVYDKLSDRLGHLHPRIVATVVNFYGFIKFLNAIQGTRAHYVAGATEFANFYASELASVATAFRPLFQGAFTKYRVTSPELQPIIGTA